MKTLKLLTTLSILLFFISCGQTKQTDSQDFYSQLVQSDDKDCDKETLKVVAIIGELAKFRSSNEKPFSTNDDTKIRSLVEKLKNKEDLILLARLTRNTAKFAEGRECFKSRLEETYSRAFWYAIEILAKDRSEENLEKMKSLKIEFNIDGGDSYDWSTIVDRIPQP